jgi:rfaE bifunctional protein kinase chain/domain
LNHTAYIESVFENFNKLKVLIVGDVMIDAYLWGKVERISPEAPVPIVAVQKKENRPGGAANVAINVMAMGAEPWLCCVTGDDDHGKTFQNLMQGMGMETSGIVASKERITTVKTRIIGNQHQMLRVDEENTGSLSDNEEKQLKQAIMHWLEKKPDVIIMEDYDKGVLSPSIISFVIREAESRKIPTAVDPKKKNFLSYKNVSLFKPNLKELREGMKAEFSSRDHDAIKMAVSRLKREMGIGTALVTLSEQGVYISGEEEEHIIPAHDRGIVDVSGAGDTVISVASLCLALGISPWLMASLANLAGGLVCEEAGVVPVNKERLLSEAKVVFPDIKETI